MALYGRPCNTPSCWREAGEKLIFWPYMIRETLEKIEIIRQQMKATQDGQKSYVNKRCRFLISLSAIWYFFKISLLKNVIRLGSKEKMTPRFVGPFLTLDRIGNFAYRVNLPQRMMGVHNVFHISRLWKFMHDSGVNIAPDQLNDMKIEPEAIRPHSPICIIRRDMKQHRRKTAKLVKVQLSERKGHCT